MKTSRSSQPTLFGPSISSAEAFPAKIFPARGKDSASNTENDPACGVKCSASLANSCPAGCWLRTSLLCELEGLTGLLLIWKRSATPSGRSWWVLGRSVLRTKETERGSWPTATVFGNTNRKGASANSGDGLRTAVFQHWPTPSKMDGDRGPERQETKDARGSDGTALPGAVMWPSPGANDEKNLGESTPGKSPQLCHLPGPLGAVKINRHGNLRVSFVLNSDWVGCLMGFPFGWCDV